MCIFSKQILNFSAGLLAFFTLLCGPIVAQTAVLSQNTTVTPSLGLTEIPERVDSAGSISAGDSHGGVINELHVMAPPGWVYQVERQPGSFVDCGKGRENRISDKNGRDSANLACGVTITETLVIPAASESARLIVHF